MTNEWPNKGAKQPEIVLGTYAISLEYIKPVKKCAIKKCKADISTHKKTSIIFFPTRAKSQFMQQWEILCKTVLMTVTKIVIWQYSIEL